VVGGNHLTEGYVVTPHTEELLKQHLKETGGNVRCNHKLCANELYSTVVKK